MISMATNWAIFFWLKLHTASAVVLPETDTAARFGGDQFVVILNELGSEATDATIQAKAVAEKIRIALSETLFRNG